MNAGRSAAGDQLRRARCTRRRRGRAAPDRRESTARVPRPTTGRTRRGGSRGRPGRDAAVAARRAASNTIAPAFAGSVTVAADLVIDDRIGTWSSSCNDPAPQRPCGARPPSTTTGDPLNHADVTAETPFVIPGPAVSAASPGLPGQLGVGLGGERGGLFVAGVDDAHPLVAGRLVERPDVARRSA